MVHGPLHALFQCFRLPLGPRAPIARVRKRCMPTDHDLPIYVRNLSDFEVASLENDGNADAER